MSFDELVQVHIQELGGDAEMSTEVEALREADHAVLVFGIPFAQLLQDIDFDKSLLVEALLVSNNLHCDKCASLVIDTSDDLSKASLAKNVYNFVSESQMISWYDAVVTPFVIIAKVGGTRL